MPASRSTAILSSLILALATARATAQGPPDRPATREEIVNAMKDLERTLGFPQTGNFLERSEPIKAYYRCYYTGKLELPGSYDELKLREGSEAGCAIDEGEYDVFFYPMDAVANGRSAVTASLAASRMERLLVVVPHEDFHEHKEARKLPAAIGEAAATLIGFLTAGEFARQKFGPAAAVHENLARDAGLFLEKARIVNSSHAELSRLYAAVRSGEVGELRALALKEELFARLGEQCGAIRPDPSSFNKCPGARNNAGLAFDMSYTRHYPLMYELYRAHHKDLKKTIEALNRVLTRKPASEQEALASLQQEIAQASGGPPSP